MKGEVALLFLIILNLCYISACSGVNLNNASLEELDKIIWVGSATAQKIINARLFSSVDDLVKVSGIGETKLRDIKEQGLACVDFEDDNSTDKENEEKPEEEIQEITNEDNEAGEEKDYIPSLEIKAVELNKKNESIIKLNPEQEIKQETSGNVIYESKNEIARKYAIYFFAFFLIFIIVVLLLKR